MSTTLIRSDLVRLRTVPAPLVGAATVAVASLSLVSLGFASIPAQHAAELVEVLAVPPYLAALALLILGALGGTSDFQHGTADMTFLAEPRRGRVLASRALAYAAIGVVLAGVCSAVCVMVANAIANSRGLVLPELPTLAASTGGAVLAGALCGAMGVGVGFAVRSSVPALLGVVIWATIGEGLIGNLVPSPLLPIGAVQALGGAPTQGETPAWLPATTLLAYTALALIIGVRRLRRDIDA